MGRLEMMRRELHRLLLCPTLLLMSALVWPADICRILQAVGLFHLVHLTCSHRKCPSFLHCQFLLLYGYHHQHTYIPFCGQVVMTAFNPSMWEAEVSESLWLQTQLGLQRELQDTHSYIETHGLNKPLIIIILSFSNSVLNITCVPSTWQQ